MVMFSAMCVSILVLVDFVRNAGAADEAGGLRDLVSILVLVDFVRNDLAGRVHIMTGPGFQSLF